MQVLLKIVDTMQVMQQSMLNSREEIGEEPEVVRVSPQLPGLPEWCPESAPIDFNDWLTCLEVHMSDLSSNSQHWWEATMKVVSTWYAPHDSHSNSKTFAFPELPDHLKPRKWSRLEKRAASLLMASIPETLREEVVASKALSTHGIMSKAMLVYHRAGSCVVFRCFNTPLNHEKPDMKVPVQLHMSSWCCFCLRFAWSLTGSCPSVAIVFESIALLPCSFVGSLSLPRTSSSLTNFLPIQCGFRLTRFTCFTCSKGILLGCGVFVVVCLVCLFGLFCLCSVSFCVVLFPFAPLHALALSLTGAQRTDSSFASKKKQLHMSS